MNMEIDGPAIQAALRDVLEEELGAGRYDLAGKWEGGRAVFEPREGEPIECSMDVFFRRLAAVRDRLRALERAIAHHRTLPPSDQDELRQLLARAYGSMTTFNVLFHDETDRFVGMKG